jgi:hypothetical protein
MKKRNNDLEFFLKKLQVIEKKLNNIDSKLNDISRLLNNKSNDPIIHKIQQWSQLSEK